MEGERRRHQGDKRAGIKEELFRLGVKGIRFTVILPGFGQKGLISPLFHLPKGGGHLQCPAGAGEVRREGKDRAVVIPRLDPLHQLRLRQRLDREVEAEVPLPELGHIRKEAGKFLVLRQEDGQTLGLVSGRAGAVEGGVNGKFRQFNCPQPFPQPGRKGGFRPGDRFREVGGEAYSYASDYEIVGKLKQFADKHCICVLTVHHTRKQPAGDAFEMISGTTGLLGCADGSLLMQKKKRTALEATIDVVGRDQQDQILYLKKDPETQIWNLERMETEPHKEPPDPVLEAVAKLVSAECPEWTGSPSELAATVQVGMAANALTKYLNVKSGRLLEDYHVGYENRARHAGRQVKLTYMLVEAPNFEVVEDGRDGSDGCNGENATTQTTVAIVAAVAERNGNE